MDINAAFAAQHGLITRAQALAYGLTTDQIKYRLATGAWTSTYRSVYRASAVPESWEADVLAACLATGGIASHLCAAALWNLDVSGRPTPEIVIVEAQSARTPVPIMHRTRQWELRDEATRRGIPCTGVERTILDCAGTLGYRRTERLAEAAIRKELTSWLRLADCLKEHSARGRNGCGVLRQLLHARLGTGAIPLSDFSRRIVHLLERANVPSPMVEYVVRDAQGRHLLQVDLAWPGLRKAWELNGLAYHFGREDIERDRRKRNAVIAEGWTIQEILWSMYVDDPKGLVAMARKFLAT